ncbi:hypothetical protein [Chitinophaga defluvii]|uniref:Glycogen biosynthesis protein GlgD n=1 Tax=Chitinophaga defluvii TaxID=3163343 RepID=A0ABV2T827_9BACT
MKNNKQQPAKADIGKQGEKTDKHSTAYKQVKQHPVEILSTDKAANGRNPMHGDLSEKPEKENKTVRDAAKNK